MRPGVPAVPASAPSLRAFAVLAAIGAAFAMAGCGGDDSEESAQDGSSGTSAATQKEPIEPASDELITRLEATLKEAIVQNSPPIEEIQCPSDIDPNNGDQGRFDCKIIGKNENGHVTVDPLGGGHITYGGQYAGRTELGQNITIE
jgi:hypothetical protein